MSNIINPYRYATGGGGFSNDYSVDFDGVDQYCDLGFNNPAESAMTYMGWIKSTATRGVLISALSSTGLSKDTRGGIVWNSSNWYLVMGNGGIYDSNSSNSASAFLDGDWHHVAVVIDEYDWTCYVDGSEDCTWTSSVSAGAAGSYPLSIGRWGSYTASYYTDGKLDEVAFFTSALDSLDIEDIYNSGTPTDLTDYSPYGWWRMGDINGGSGTTIADQGSAGNDGTLINSPTYSSDVPT